VSANPNFEATLADLVSKADRPVVLHLVTGARVLLSHEGGTTVSTGVVEHWGTKGRTAIATQHIVSAYVGDER
jgi:hypothetical protein